MDLEILYIKDNGTLDKERVVLLVKEDCDLGHYILATSHMNAEGETFSSKIANTFWLPDQKVQKGDKVVIYTKEGVKNSRSNEDKTTSYFYYWGLNKPLNSDDDNTCVVVFRASWMVERVPYNAGN